MCIKMCKGINNSNVNRSLLSLSLCNSCALGASCACVGMCMDMCIATMHLVLLSEQIGIIEADIEELLLVHLPGILELALLGLPSGDLNVNSNVHIIMCKDMSADMCTDTPPDAASAAPAEPAAP